MPSERRIWQRRIALMALVGLLVAVPVTMALRGGGPAGEDEALEVPPVGELEFDRRLGVELRLPEGWRRKREEDRVVFRSGDRSSLIAVAAPGPPEDRDAIHQAAVRAIRSEYRRVRLGSRSGKQLVGGRRARITALAARRPKAGGELRVLVATVEGREHTYLVELFAGGAEPGQALVEAQLVLNNLRLRG